MRLQEVFVEKDYIRKEPITPKCLTFKNMLKGWFGDELFSFKQVQEKCEPIGIHKFATVAWLNMLFKHGDIRKFVRGQWAGHEHGKYSKHKQNRAPGKYYGVHYKFKG